MKQVFIVNTPAQAHQFRPAVQELERSGHAPLVLARDYGCTIDLLEFNNLPYEIYGAAGMEKNSLYRRLPKHYYQVCKRVLQYDPDVVFGRSVFAAHAGTFARTPTILIVDSEVTSIDHRLSRPVADLILTPHTFKKHLGDCHYRFNGFTECAYLHPNVREPTTDIRSELGLAPDDHYAILRFNCLRAHHDVGESGFTIDQRNRLIEKLSDHVTVFVSDEAVEGGAAPPSAQAYDLHPALMHDALAEAELLIADTQTMVTEAALLGTPAIRSNSFVGDSDMGNFLELEQAGLIRNHADFDDVLDSAQELLADETAHTRWQQKSREFMADKVDLTDLIVYVALSYDRVNEFERLKIGTVEVES
jgi:predicted glycosyltransferase